MKKSMKKPLKIFLIVLGCVVALFLIFVTICCIGSDSNSVFIENNFGAIGSEAQYYYDAENGNYCFVKPDDRKFKILQLTDTHIGGGVFCEGKDKKALNAIYDMVAGTRPDLVIITGDVTYPFPFHSGNIDNMKTARQVAAFMEKLEVPWTLVFGNHDNEAYSFANREKLADFYASDELEHCVFTKNPKGESITGFGNQLIKVLNGDGTLNNALVLFDSNSNVKGNIFKYDIIHDNQVEWYKRAIVSLSTEENGFSEGEIAPSLVFTHIPLNEYQTAWDLYASGSGEAEYLYGVKDEDILAPSIGKKLPKGKLFDEMVKLGSTKAVFCGHNHKNNFAIVYKGIQLTYSKSIVYLGLFGIGKTDAYRGGTVIELDSDGAFKSTSVSINEVRQ